MILRSAEQADRPVRTLCMTLAYTGCRLSEALALTADRVDIAASVLIFENLKKRRIGIFGGAPVPPALLDALDMMHGIGERHGRCGKDRAVRLWPSSRMTGWRAGTCGDAGRRSGRRAGLTQEVAVRLRCGRRHCRHPARLGAKMAWARPAQHDGRLYERRWRG